MPHPKDVFDDPAAYWQLLTAVSDTDFECQHFDRKEACRVDRNGYLQTGELNKVKGQIQECISAFSNANKEGGLLVLGIASDGDVKGIGHLSEGQFSDLTRLNDLLIHHAARSKFFDCVDADSNPQKICLIYAGYVERYICETPGNSPKAWMREGRHNTFIDDTRKEQIRREKGIVEFETTPCCVYDPSDLDEEVVAEFRRNYLQHANNSHSIEEMLRQAGAIIRTNLGYEFTNAGVLFFASNPQRVMPWGYIRLLRFSAKLGENNRGLPTFEQPFTGTITRQIRLVRTFFKESGFFKSFQRRNPKGGFIEEPELPFIAVDEAIVNAVAHRDYGMRIPIEAELYKDAFQVRNSGRIRQRDKDVPDNFSLHDTKLDSAPRNPLLIEWLKLLRNEKNIPFVKALSEGTESMRRAMEDLGLPAPIYNVTATQTTVTLLSDAERREAEFRSDNEEEATEFANLFPVSFDQRRVLLKPEERSLLHKDFTGALKDALTAKRWYVDSFKFSRIIAHRQGYSLPLPQEVSEKVRFYPAYSFQLRNYKKEFYLSIDYTLEVKNVRNLKALLLTLNANELIGKTATVHWHDWQLGRIVSCDIDKAKIHLFDYEKEEIIDSEKVIPNLSRRVIENLLKAEGIRFDINRAIKQHSLALEPSASRSRLEKTQTIAETISKSVFPLVFNGTRAYLTPTLTPLSHRSGSQFPVAHLHEPNVVFGQGRAEADIREGITKFGAYTETAKTIELVPICTTDLRDSMAALIDRLKAGKYKYRGSERTFHTRFTYNSIITVPSPERILGECERLLKEHQEWVGNENLDRLFLIYVPEAGHSIDDEESPYYRIKRFLFERGIPCQMVDTPTLTNPDWKDLNLSLNIVAKCGVTPWVLPDAIPDADFFVGLSYTQNAQRSTKRLMGYANVFNSFGRWVFYSGNTETFAYEERANHFKELVTNTLERLTLSETPSIYFHYSAKFSKEDKAVILNAARRVRPKGTYSFVWINTHHNVRLYDVRAETDGSLSRGSYLITTPNQFFLSTTGYNPYRKVLGTPQMLEINVRTERPEGMPQTPPDLKAIAVQILSLTKLNWASTDSLCAEPITTKYAGSIAYLTSAFLRQNEEFQLHAALEKTPWFI